MEVKRITPGADPATAETLLHIQRGAYAVEAAIIDDYRIPALTESIDELRAAPVSWYGALREGTLLGAIAWSETDVEVNIARLVVDPLRHRQGVGRSLVRAVLEMAGNRRTVVSTGRANVPARTLYEGLGFVAAGDKEVVPGLWITRFTYPGGVDRRCC